MVVEHFLSTQQQLPILTNCSLWLEPWVIRLISDIKHLLKKHTNPICTPFFKNLFHISSEFHIFCVVFLPGGFLLCGGYLNPSWHCFYIQVHRTVCACRPGGSIFPSPQCPLVLRNDPHRHRHPGGRHEDSWCVAGALPCSSGSTARSAPH